MDSGQCWITLLLPVVLWLASHGVRGYDGYSACPKQYRSVRHRAQLPCDFQQQSWCTVPGSAYPWHAVRRFVHENHGLMRRMYGDERHISVLRAEIESNDVELVRDAGWHLDDDVKRRYSAKPHFRPANRNHHQPQPPPPLPPTPLEAVASTAPAPPTRNTAAADSISTTTTTSTTLSSATSSTIAAPSTTSATSTSTESTTTTSPSTTVTPTPGSSVDPQAEPVGLFNGRIHPHLINASLLVSSSSPPPRSTTTSTTAPSTTSTSAPDTTLDEWATDETTLTTLQTISSPSQSTSTATTTSSTTKSGTDEEELAEVEDNVADDVDGDGDTASSSQQETLFQDADNLPGPDAAQQPGKPATPLIKLRGVNACPVKEEVVAPFWANNTRGEVLALLNLYPFEQYVHWEKCTHEHKQMFCREGCRCEQQYRLHRLLAYDPNNECRGIFSDWFKFPSCCICRCYDLPAEFRFTSRSPRTPVLRAPAAAAAPVAMAARHPRAGLASPHVASVKDWYRLQASSGDR